MNGAPDWQDGECCFRCRTQFTLVARKHHCRNCGNIFCAKCSSQSIPLPNLNIEKSVRVCDSCHEKLSTKNEDSLSSTSESKNDNSQIKKEKSSSSSSKSSKSANSNRPAASASAPSEQDLKEEEDLQLALALSLSEAPAKISFPDCRQLEEVNSPVISSAVNKERSSSSNSVKNLKPIIANPVSNPDGPQTMAPLNYDQALNSLLSEKQFQHTSNFVQPSQYQEQSAYDQDQELFKFVAELQSTSEVFTNRVNSNKMRNRPIADDSAIQTLFLKLTNMHAKLLEYIKIHDDERSKFEALQDKLSQISDARAALDALREEHQEKMRQEAAEAERQRQSQLAQKLEMMRQKKSQMMQYQREMALQRIQAQEILLRQPQGYQPPATTIVSQHVLPQQIITKSPMPQQQTVNIPDLATVQQQSSMTHQVPNQPQSQVQQQFYPQHAGQMGHHFATSSQNQAISQTPIPQAPKLEDEAPLISFDD